MFQIQLNEALQAPEFNFAAMYAFYIVFTFVVSFYGFLVPLATPLLILVFAIQYWVDKFNLFKRYSCSIDYGSELIGLIFKYFEISAFLFTIGFLLWDIQIHTESSALSRVLNVINLVISIGYISFQLFIPLRWKQKIMKF